MESLEVLLKADATRPGLPVAELPAEILRQLEVEILIMLMEEIPNNHLRCTKPCT